MFKIGAPTMFKHVDHVGVDPSSPMGLSGLPKEWLAFLLTSGVTKEEILKNAESVIRILNKNGNLLAGKEVNVFSAVGSKAAAESVPLPSQKQATADLNWEKILKQNVDVEKLYPTRTKVGEGSTGTVYVTKNKDATSKGYIALKVMNISEDGASGNNGIVNDMKAIMNEVAMMNVCQSCPQIVHFYEAFFAKDERTEVEKVRVKVRQLWIAMEYLGGGCLTNVLTVSGSVSDSLTAYVMREMLYALQFLHKNHRIHRDIKSDNVLLSMDGDIKLADFGFCAQLTDEVKRRKSIVGTPYWMSPELVEGLEYDESVDIWSAGITAIECAEGLPPHMNVPPFRVLFLITSSPAPTLQKPNEHTPLLSEFLRCCLNRDPKKRWSAARLLTHPFIAMAAKKEEFIPHILKSRAEMKVKDGL